MFYSLIVFAHIQTRGDLVVGRSLSNLDSIAWSLTVGVELPEGILKMHSNVRVEMLACGQ